MTRGQSQGSGHESPLLVVAMNGIVMAIERGSGHIRWRNELKGGGYGRVAMDIQADRVYVSASRPKVFCLDYETGEEVWSSKTKSSGDPSILVDGESIYVCKGGYVERFDLEGERMWLQECKGAGVSRASLGVPGHVVLAAGGEG